MSIEIAGRVRPSDDVEMGDHRGGDQTRPAGTRFRGRRSQGSRKAAQRGIQFGCAPLGERGNGSLAIARLVSDHQRQVHIPRIGVARRRRYRGGRQGDEKERWEQAHVQPSRRHRSNTSPLSPILSRPPSAHSPSRSFQVVDDKRAADRVYCCYLPNLDQTMDEQGQGDSLSRVAVRQLLWLGVAGTAAFVALMATLAWASSMTGGGQPPAGGRLETKTITACLLTGTAAARLDARDRHVSFLILGHVMEGLLRYDANNRLVPGVAERWEIRPEGATFWLRDNARWSDGQAGDRARFCLRVAKGGGSRQRIRVRVHHVLREERRGDQHGKDAASELGVRAVSDRTLEVQFERPSRSSTSSSRSGSTTRCGRTSTRAESAATGPMPRTCSITVHSR